MSMAVCFSGVRRVLIRVLERDDTVWKRKPVCSLSPTWLVNLSCCWFWMTTAGSKIKDSEKEKDVSYTQRLKKNTNREREMFYLTTHSTHFIYGYMVSDIWLRTILIVRKETRCRHIGYSYRLTARVLLYAPSHRPRPLLYQSWNTGTRNSSMGPPHDGSIRRPIAPWANALPLSYVPLPHVV